MSEFSQNQCGAKGFISRDDLLTQTRRHEYNSPTQSHWGFYAGALNSYNPGPYIEARVAPPGSNVMQFNDDTRDGVNSLVGQVTTAAQVEPYPVNYSETNVPLGNINFGPPYASCN